MAILIIENDVFTAKRISKSLRDASICSERDIILCNSAEEAIGICDILQEVPDLIICDTTLPGISGLDFCKIVKSRGTPCASIPILFISAVPDKLEVSLKADILGASGFIPKPIDYKRLVRMSMACVSLSHATKERSQFITKYMRHEHYGYR